MIEAIRRAEAGRGLHPLSAGLQPRPHGDVRRSSSRPRCFANRLGAGPRVRHSLACRRSSTSIPALVLVSRRRISWRSTKRRVHRGSPHHGLHKSQMDVSRRLLGKDYRDSIEEQMEGRGRAGRCAPSPRPSARAWPAGEHRWPGSCHERPAFVLSPLDTASSSVSLLLVVVVGFWAARGQSETARGYFLASDRLPWWIIGSAFVSTSVSSEQIVGTVGAAYQHGMAIANWEWWCLPTYTLLLLLFIPVYLKNRIATVPEFLSKRFGPLCGDIYSWVMLRGLRRWCSRCPCSTAAHWFFPADRVEFHCRALGHGGARRPVHHQGRSRFGHVDRRGPMRDARGWRNHSLFCCHRQNSRRVGTPWSWPIPSASIFITRRMIPIAPFLGLICGSLGVFLFYQASNQVMIQRCWPPARPGTA